MNILFSDAPEHDDIAAEAPQSAQTPTSALAAVEERIVKLQELAALTEAGVLTAEESAAVKTRLLAS